MGVIPVTERIRLAIACDKKCETCRVDRACEFNGVVEQVGIATDQIATLALLESNAVDVLVVDSYLPVFDIVTVVRNMLQARFGLHIIFVANEEDIAVLDGVWRNNEFVHVIKTGELETFLNKKFGTYRTNHKPNKTDADGHTTDLTSREQDVLRLLAIGHTNNMVANFLFISTRTVESHRAKIVLKLHTASRAELVEYAMKHHLFTNTGTGDLSESDQ